MPKLNVPPTKSNLLKLKRELVFAHEGYEMLEQKRQILTLELVGMVENARRAQQEVWAKMETAFGALREAAIRSGTVGLAAGAAAPRPEHSAEIASRSLMGVYLPSVRAHHPPIQPVLGLMAGSPALDGVAEAFSAALESTDRLAEVENSVFRLAREVRKTMRRVNALEKTFIPSYEETIRFIAGTLEERERDEFIVLRKVKDRLDRKRRAQQQPPG